MTKILVVRLPRTLDCPGYHGTLSGSLRYVSFASSSFPNHRLGIQLDEGNREHLKGFHDFLHLHGTGESSHTSAAAGAPPTAPSSRTVPQTIGDVSVLLATQGVDAMSQTLQFIMSARRFVWLSTEEKAELIKQVLLGNPRVEELIAKQLLFGQVLSQRFWEPRPAYYGSDDEDEDEDGGNKVAVDSAEIEDLLKEYKLVSKRQREKEEREDDEGDEEESDDEEDDEEEEENEEPGEGQKGEGKGSKKTSRAMALCEEINALLLKAGIKDPARTSKCMRAGLAKGYYGKFTGEAKQLDKVVWTGSCLTCRKTLKATARQLLKQPDYAGLDYEEGGSSAVIRCSEDCDGLYVTSLCDGKPEADSGKFHNHCRACPGLGKCLRDYREEHCDDCGEHYFAGMSGFPCPCSKEKQMLTKAKAGDRHALAALFFRVSDPFGAEDDEADMMGAMGEGGGGQENCVVM